jgi:hypothetical protein
MESISIHPIWIGWDHLREKGLRHPSTNNAAIVPARLWLSIVIWDIGLNSIHRGRFDSVPAL